MAFSWIRWCQEGRQKGQQSQRHHQNAPTGELIPMCTLGRFALSLCFDLGLRQLMRRNKTGKEAEIGRRR